MAVFSSDLAAYTIRALAARTGVSAHTIRAWERRFNALTPSRTPTNRRVYDDADCERLEAIRWLAEAGHSVMHLAPLTTDELKRMAGDLSTSTNPAPNATWFERCSRAVDELDDRLLEQTFARALIELGARAFVVELVAPLCDWLDTTWREGRSSVAQEHCVTSTVRSSLDRLRLSLAPGDAAPRILITTPARQLHELGALMAAVLAALEGWDVLYLGPNTPANDIADAALKVGAQAIGLSIVYPTDDAELALELQELRLRLPILPIFVGGRGAKQYAAALEAIQAPCIEDLQGFGASLLQLDIQSGRRVAASFIGTAS